MFAIRVSLFLTVVFSFLFAQEETAQTDTPAVSQEIPAIIPSLEMADAGTLLGTLFGAKKTEESKDGYTINYTTVSMVEYVRFASKICKINFIYTEADLNFTITVVSDEPVTPANVMATLIQVLRIHGLLLLEQDNNLVIHKEPGVKQIAKLVTEGAQQGNAPIVTRIFRVKNARAESISAIIQPMISTSAILEVSPETKQIIITDVTANVDKIAALIENLDSPHTTLEIQKYVALHNAPEYLVQIGTQIMNPIVQGSPFILVPQDLSHEIFIVSTPEYAAKAIDVFTRLDIPAKEKKYVKKLKPEDVYVYKVMYRSGPDVLKGLANIADSLKDTDTSDSDLIDTIESAKWIRETNSILFVGSKASIAKTQEFLGAIDIPLEGVKTPEKVSFFIYKPQYKSADDTRRALLEMADNLKGTKGISESLVETIQNTKVNPLTHTLTFTGPENDFPRIKELLATIDSSTGKISKPEMLPSTQFFIYKPEHQTGEELAESIKEVSGQLKSDKLADPGLMNALSSMKWVKSTNSLLFTGDPESLKKVQTLIATLDIPSVPLEKTKTFYQFQPKYADEQKTDSYLKQVSQNLSKKEGSESLIETLKTVKWIPESRTFMFYGSPKDLDKVKLLLSTFDTPELAAKPKPGYYIYKVQHTTGDLIEEDLDNLVKSLKATGVKESPLVDVIEKMRYVKQTNSLVLSGDPQGIEEAKKLILEYDYPRAATLPTTSNFFMYKPVHLPAKQIEKSLKELATNLKGAGLADPSLLQSIDSSKYVESTNTLVFTGSSETINKIQAMLKDVDIPPANYKPIQQVGKTTFLLYKLKYAGGSQIVGSLKNMSAELKKSGTADKDFLSALSSVKYVKETNSLFFTGNEESLSKIQTLVEQFDIPSLAPTPTAKTVQPMTGPGNYFVYKPQSLTGPDLELFLQNFSENLRSSGLVDDDLYRTINSVRWSEQTQTLVFTGTQKSIDQVKDLLKEFDIPSNVADKQRITTPLEPTIQAIDNTSFLVYKLQFHKGDEIQNALRQIAKDLMLTNAPINSGLLNSINSIQWLEVTNSLLCSGDQETLTRLRELIKNLDIPLKQVFIEMLVIETTLTNALQFGLEWGANYKYRNKFGAASYNSQPITTGSSPSTWLQNLSGFQPPTEPNPVGKIPVSSGFDLGVIGEVIKHNGQTFLTLGSLLSALQTDDESSIIMTPKILTQDGRTSTIFDGRNIPFVGSFVQNAGSNTVNTSNIEYRDVGLNLTVTPVLGNSDIVTLDINLDRTQTVGDVTGTINFTTTSATGITTSKTTMRTTVHVPDNNFLILSGMVNNSNTKSKAGIPCLGGLPLIGAAFSKNNDTIVNSNIVIFIRPHIINSVDEIRNITRNEEDYFRDQAGTPFLERGFDEAMELIKTVDDD